MQRQLAVVPLGFWAVSDGVNVHLVKVMLLHGAAVVVRFRVSDLWILESAPNDIVVSSNMEYVVSGVKFGIVESRMKVKHQETVSSVFSGRYFNNNNNNNVLKHTSHSIRTVIKSDNKQVVYKPF